MRLTVVGSADAFNAAGRGSSAYVLEAAAGSKLMIDFGPTALAGLRRAGMAPNDLDAIAFTHLHGDHAAGFPFFVIDALFNDARERPLTLFGPVLTQRVLTELVGVMYGDVRDDLARLKLEFQEVEPGESRDVAGFTLTAFAADHMKPPHRPLCLRVSDRTGKIVAFSGDTRLCPGLFEAADGADLLVAECTRLAPPAGQHCTWQEWREALPNTRARAVLLTHLGADVRERVPELLRAYDRGPALRFAEDGLVLDV